jgi:hypothetical protein
MIKMWDLRARRCWVASLGISLLLTAITLGRSSALAQTFNSGGTGADGAFNPTTSTTLTLPPDGVFNFTTINIPAGVTVTFARNAANTPVTMLASGNVIIAGAINLNGGAGGNAVSGTNVAPNGGLGGPGGFNGGDGADAITSTAGGAGLGPGGGGGGVFQTQFSVGSGGAGGSFATAGGSFTSAVPGPTYGVNALLPLIGGSGGGGGAASFGFTAGGGGGGAGAILIASSATITFTGGITAIGGKGGNNPFGAGDVRPGAGAGGSGGAVRLVATTITGSGGSISVAGGGEGSGFGSNTGGAGGLGRIRVEAYTNTATITYAQVPSIDKPGVVALPNAPSLMITSVAGVPAPASPGGSFSSPDIVLPAGTPNPMTITLAASNIPLGTTVTVTVKPLDGAASSATSTPLVGTLTASTATASLSIPTNQPSVISASATFTLAALPDAGLLFAQGEQVERIRVAAVLGGPPTITYITRSGREVPADALLDRQLVDGVRR